MNNAYSLRNKSLLIITSLPISEISLALKCMLTLILKINHSLTQKSRVLSCLRASHDSCRLTIHWLFSMALLLSHSSTLLNYHSKSTYAGWMRSTLKILIYYCLSRNKLVGHSLYLLRTDILSWLFRVISSNDSEKAGSFIIDNIVDDAKNNRLHRLQQRPLEINGIQFAIFFDARLASDKDNASQLRPVSVFGYRFYSANAVCCTSVESKIATRDILASYLRPLYMLLTTRQRCGIAGNAWTKHPSDCLSKLKIGL